MNKDQSSSDRRKDLHLVETAGRDAKMLKENRAFLMIMDIWRKNTIKTMAKCDAFDSNGHIRGKITLDNIDILENLIDSTILQGKNAGLELSGQTDESEGVGIL